jgi:hypothetical protein
LGKLAWSDFLESPSRAKAINRLGVILFNLGVVGVGAGALVWLRRRRDPRFVPLLVPFVALAFLTYFTRSIGSLQNIQPWRLRYLFLAVASAAAALPCAEALRAGGYRRLLAVGAGLFACLYFLAFDARPDVQPLQVGFSPVQRSWMAAINAMADQRSRILVEDGPGYRGMGVSALHLGTNAQWIGGPYRAAYVTYHRVSFISGRLAERPLASYSEDELAQFLRRYNVRWILCWTPESKRVLDGHPTLVRRLQEIDGLAFYELATPAESFYERGSGAVQADLDSLRLSGVSAEGGSVVLRYHYYDHLVAEGAGALRPYAIPGDPVGFIEVVDPGREVWIHSRHGRH